MIIVFDNLKKCINSDAILGFEVVKMNDGDYYAIARMSHNTTLKMLSCDHEDFCWKYILSILDFIAKDYKYVNSHSILENLMQKEEGEYLN